MPVGVFEYLIDLLVMEPAVRRAREKSRTGDLDGAVNDLKVLIEARGETSRRLNALAWVLIKNGEVAEALPHIERAMLLAPKNTKYMATCGRAYRRLGRLNEALALMEARYNENKADAF